MYLLKVTFVTFGSDVPNLSNQSRTNMPKPNSSVANKL